MTARYATTLVCWPTGNERNVPATNKDIFGQKVNNCNI
jgi:hypothetical protein